MMNIFPAAIIVEVGKENGRIFPLLQSQTVIGRDKINQITLADHRASREHASITREDSRFLLRDLDSTNGSWLNNQRVTSPRPLQDGDQIKIGDTILRFNKYPGQDTFGDYLRQMRLFSNLKDQALAEMSAKAEIRHFARFEKIPVDQLENVFGVILTGELLLNIPETNTILTRKSFPLGCYFDGTRRIPPGSFFTPSQETWLLILDRRQIDELIVTFIHQTPFGNLPDEHLKAIAHQMIIESHKKGHWLFQQGDYADSLYVVIFGEVAMMRRSEQEDRQSIDDEIRTYDRGSLFGELGLLANEPRAAGGLIKEETSLLVLPRDRFNDLVKQHPEIAFNLYRYIASLLEEQSVDFWRAARDVEKMQELLQSNKMTALGHLVAGIAHEINTPVGSISANSYHLGNRLTETQQYIEGLPAEITAFTQNETALRSIAGDLNIPFDDSMATLISRYTAALINHLETYHQKADLDFLLEDTRDISEELSEASNRIKGIVKNLANFARLDEAERKTVDIHEGIDATLALLHHELKYQVDVIKEYGPLPDITCHPNELNQVFMNIIMNAIQAMELEELQKDDRGLIRIKTYREKDMAVVSISDSGKGISPENMTRVFEPFFSTKEAAAAAGGLGLGLGLAISKKIIEEKHNGRIEVESEPGQGATFYIKLPLDKSNSTLTTQTMILNQIKELERSG